MHKSIYLSICLYISLSVSLNGQVINSQEVEKNEGIKRNTFYNLEEIKVRWKKAALENCTGVPCVTTCGIISDIDGNSYNTVLIGTQCWTKENLRVRRYNNSTAIPFDTSGSTSGSASYESWSSLTYGAHTLWSHDSTATPSNLNNYGYLYNWYAAKGIAAPGSTTYINICPTGWHVPSDSDWNKLVKYLDSGADTSGVLLIQSTSAGSIMKSTSLLWNIGSPGTDLSGFSALPGGCRNIDGIFRNIMDFGYFWSTTENNSTPSRAWHRRLVFSSSNVERTTTSGNDKRSGASVRCLKD
jgi:uncharacterized protein (TIGR02145 family)